MTRAFKQTVCHLAFVTVTNTQDKTFIKRKGLSWLMVSEVPVLGGVALLSEPVASDRGDLFTSGRPGSKERGSAWVPASPCRAPPVTQLPPSGPTTS